MLVIYTLLQNYGIIFKLKLSISLVIIKLKKTLIQFIATIKWLVIGIIAVTFLNYFFMFFAYDMNPLFIHMHDCKKQNGTWNPELNACEVNIYR